MQPPIWAKELSVIKNILSDETSKPINRSEVARRKCAQLGWYNIQGKPKEMGARVALLRLHRNGWIELPGPKHRNSNGGNRKARLTSADIPQYPGSDIDCPLNQLGCITLKKVDNREDSLLWDALIERYHYLGHSPLSGAQIRYLIESDIGLVGAIGFGAAAFSIRPRDIWIGWDHKQCNQRRERILNNRRFLILPWIRVKNLASHILSKVTRQIPNDFQLQYGYRPLLLETFVEQDRFTGGCYRAANWIPVGLTTGRGRNDRRNYKDRIENGPLLPIKQIWLYPLHRKACQQLTSPLMEVSA